MISLINEIQKRFQVACSRAFDSDFANIDMLIRPAQDEKFGDYQSNLAMSLAKQLKKQPREIAQQIIQNLQIDDICEEPKIAGPGFINLTLKPDWLANRVKQLIGNKRLGISETANPKNIIVDYSGPNIAKQMHVGHLRSTILGDVIARVLEFLGENVIRQNHIGDWGTQFGMLIAYLVEQSDNDSENTDFHISDIEEFYKQANKRFNEDENFANRARNWVVKLQSGDEQALKLWEKFREESLKHCQKIYDMLNVKLTSKDIRGESFYNNMLPEIVNELINKKIAVEDDGAICVFLQQFKAKDGSPLPVLIRKSDGGFLYATTDLAAIKFRVNELKAHKIIYVTDARQKLHFEQVFAVAHKAGWDIHPITKNPVSLEHITFGSILGEDGKPLKTRSGENVKLTELLNEAVERAKLIVERKNPNLSNEEQNNIARVVGISAIKYADLSQSRTSDYIFSFDKMLAMEGNTAPYMLYAYARIKSIERKGNIKFDELPNKTEIVLIAPAEIKLTKKLMQFPDAIIDVSKNFRPNIITTYLYELSQIFNNFYENCPVLKADNETLKTSRLSLCDLTARTLKLGLELLGIETLEQM